MDDILLIGVNHKIAPVAVRERLAFGPERIPTALRELVALVTAEYPGDEAQRAEAVILSTCNRAEVYLCAADPVSAEGVVRDFLSAHGQLPLDALNAILYPIAATRPPII